MLFLAYFRMKRLKTVTDVSRCKNCVSQQIMDFYPQDPENLIMSDKIIHIIVI